MCFSFGVFIFPSNFVQGGRSALHLSAGSGHEGKEKMSLLVENGANVNAQDRVSFNLNEKAKTDVIVCT